MDRLRQILTALCLLFLALSFVPGWEALAYLSVAAGSVFALRSAWETVRERQIDVNQLMVLAAVGAVVVGEVKDAAALLFLFSLSGTLEHLAMAKTRSAIEGLIKLRPETALRVGPNGDERVPVAELRQGDSIRVLAFEAVPVDATIVEGQTSADESAMTGESVTVAKGVRDSLLAGTQNMEGMVVATVEKAVGDTTLDRIVALVEEAQESKASGERISTWFGQRYTIFVLSVFVISMFVRAAFMREAGEAISAHLLEALGQSLTLLVALSPCALVISTPASTLSALTWCARNGILVRGGEFIEKAGTLRAVALDKTGTLTEGKPELVEICVCETVSATGPCETGCWHGEPTITDESQVWLRAAAAAEQYATHPIATAIVRAARERGIDVPEATHSESVPGQGVLARVDGQRVRIGKPGFFTNVPEEFVERVRSIQSRGMTVALVQLDDRFAALGLMDVAKKEAPAFLAEMRGLGVERIVMLTGDHRTTAEAIAEQVGVKEVHAQLMPEDKTRLIGELVESERNVMMVGDGINDAPSLSRATVGVAMGGLGSDIALNAADVVLMKDRLMRLPQLIRLGRRTNSIIRANLIFAAGVIVVLTVASILNVLPLWLAVLGHEGSTVLVILNGLRLLGGPAKSGLSG